MGTLEEILGELNIEEHEKHIAITLIRVAVLEAYGEALRENNTIGKFGQSFVEKVQAL